MSLIIFSHGKESGPNGTKIQILTKVAQEMGFQTESIDYRACKDATERVSLLREYIAQQGEKAPILVGSSMGGYVSTAVANEIEVTALFLMCPALYLPNYEIQNFAPKTNNIEILHGWSDTIVPCQSSINFAKLTKAKLHLREDNHRLSNSHQFLEQIFALFLGEIKTKKNESISNRRK